MRLYIAVISDDDGDTKHYLVRAENSKEAKRKAKSFAWSYPPKKIEIHNIENYQESNDVVYLGRM